MSQPDRQASRGATAPAAQAVAGPETPPLPLPASSSESRCGPIWEAIYQHVAPHERQQLLGLARQQGLLYGHQLPPLANGARAHADHARPSLSQLLQGSATHLEPNRAAPSNIRDTALDEGQRWAVTLALSTPDLFLLSGWPGTGKTRVLAEIVTQAVARGDRVLLLSATPAPVDRLLEQIGGRDTVWAVRCLGPDDSAAGLPASVRGLTLPERIRRFREDALARAVAQRQRAEKRAASLAHDEQQLARLEPLAEEAARLEEERQRLHQQTEQLADEVTRAVAALEADPTAAGDGLAVTCGPLVRSHHETLGSLDEQAHATRQRLEACRQQEGEQNKAVQTLQPLVEARAQRRFWTASWWRALRQGNVTARLSTLEQQREQTRKERQDLEDALQLLTQQRQEAVTAYQARRTQQVDAEVQRRRTELAGPQRRIDDRLQQLAQQWRELSGPLSEDCPRPTALDRSALDAARTECHRLRELAGQELLFMKQWAAGLEQFAARADTHLPEYVNVVAGTTAAVPRDPHFGRRMDFDLLVLQQAESVTESELLTVGARARRWVLVGEPTRSVGPAHTAPASRPKKATVSTAALRVGVFDRLWQRLHCDPTPLPYVWKLDGGRLRCRLRVVPPEQQKRLEKETVADRPDIELYILTLPRSEPVLAEVLFPATMSIAQAKQYIYQEIQELAVTPAGPALSWTEDAEQIILRLGSGRTPEALAVELERGVREWVSPVGTGQGSSRTSEWITGALTFERAAGWDRTQAEHWIQHLLRLRNTGRAVYLDVPHRMRPEMAVIVADLLGSDGCVLPAAASPVPASVANGKHTHESSASTHSPCVRFLPVPPLTAETSARRQPAPRPRLPRSGAGLELDLADARCLDRLPRELREKLPQRGLVNYLEAQAVVRTLEEWAQHRPAEQTAKVVVLALYPAQAQLIRILLGQSAALAASRGHIEVEVPAAFVEREAGTILLSLTRSHSHRAVPFGDDPEQLFLALTRARDELVLFGDTGTLMRRCHWDGPLEHLDAAAAARERTLVERLVRRLEGRGPGGEAFHVCEGAHA